MSDPASPSDDQLDRPRAHGAGATQPTAGPPTDKSVGAALVLTFFFGPLGLFYIHVLGAIIATVVAVVISVLTLGFGLILVWPVCMVWSAVTASKQHQQFEAWKISRLSGGAPQGAI